MGTSGGVPWSRAGSAALATRLANLAIDFIVSKASWKAEELMGVDWGSVVIAGEGSGGRVGDCDCVDGRLRLFSHGRG